MSILLIIFSVFTLGLLALFMISSIAKILNHIENYFNARSFFMSDQEMNRRLRRYYEKH